MFYNKSTKEILQHFKMDPNIGLDEETVLKSRQQFGKNELKEEKKESLIKKFLKEFKDPLIILLIMAAIISVIVEPNDWIESLIIMVVVIMNAALGAYQENNAEKALDALKKLSNPNAKVLRKGQKEVIPSSEVVVGDLIYLEAGDYVPSDARIIYNHDLQVDESSLTGESLAIYKSDEVIDEENVPLGDQKNMVFASTICTYGRAEAIVTSVGMNNEIGKIANLLQENKNEKTPLQNKLDQISKIIGLMCIVICVLVFGLELFAGSDWLEAFKTAVALAVAAIPEGLATVVTIVLSIGVSKMAKHNAIVKTLPSVETLGCCNVICSDKTGTLTQNKMTVVKTYVKGQNLNDFLAEEVNEETRDLLKYFTLCSDASLKKEFDGRLTMIGDPTETALVFASSLLGDEKDDLNAQFERVEEIPFDSARKMMTVFLKSDEGYLQVTKGGPDVIFNRSKNVSKKDEEMNEVMANDALRVLAVAIKKIDKLPSDLDPELIEKDLSFIGLVGMIDPPRIEVKDAIEEAKKGHVKTIMITGDHISTAVAIAKDLRILEEGQKAITGAMLDAMPDEELADQIEDIRVYARVAPEHKVRIVDAFKRKGAIVAMTGDGVNDAPALKKSDIGCAMGITGTDVAKGAADVILVDDNFSTIIEAIRQGRGIYANIKKDVQFLLSSNIGEVVTILCASLLTAFTSLKIGIPLLPIHLLWINLITDTLPAFALGLEPHAKEIMQEKPRQKDESFFANNLGFTIFYQGLMIGLLTLLSYLSGSQYSHVIGMTMAFLTLALCQLFHAFNIKSEKSIFNKQVFNNKYLWLALVVGLGLQLILIYTPFFQSLFSLSALNLNQLMTAFAYAFVVIIVMEAIKLLKKIKK